MPADLWRFKADVFQALAHPTRVAIVEALGEGELSPSELTARLGLEQANVSQHLAVLRGKQIVDGRREGNQVFYSLRHPVLREVLEALKRYFYAHLSRTISTLEGIEAAAGPAQAVEATSAE